MGGSSSVPGGDDAALGADTAVPVLCPPCNPVSADDLKLDNDDHELTGWKCRPKDFSKSSVVSHSKVRLRSMMEPPGSEGANGDQQDDEDMDEDFVAEYGSDHAEEWDEDTEKTLATTRRQQRLWVMRQRSEKNESGMTVAVVHGRRNA